MPYKPYLLALLLLASPALAQEPAGLDPRHKQFLEEVAPLMNEKERAAFLSLHQEYQRDAFVQRFWQQRDPFPKTAVNEFRVRWEERVRIAKERFGDLKQERARMLLFLGEPAEVMRSPCADVLAPMEMWFYPGTERIRDEFTLVFLQPSYRLWRASEGLSSMLSQSFAASGTRGMLLEQTILQSCPRGDEILARIGIVLDWDQVKGKVIPDPGDEWLSTFLSYSTDLPEAARTFPAHLDLAFPGRYGSRTTLQALVSVPREEVTPEKVKDTASYIFVVDGEVLHKGELFEHFRYRFIVPEAEVTVTQEGKATIPLVFQRYLRPGSYGLVLRIEDVGGKRWFREQRDLEIPSVEAAMAAVNTAAPAQPTLAEANADTLMSDEQGIRILPPPPGLLTGKVRLEATTTGEGIARVSFLLNGKTVLTKGKPPYSVELNIGEQPRLHTLTAVALDTSGRKVAEDEVLLNTGPHRFSVRLVEPQAGKSYQASLRAQAQVDVPEGEKLDRVEIFLNETLLATLYQPPYVQPVIIPQNQALTYVRAVAYLADGNSSEDTVLVNVPGDFTDRMDVQFVELFTSAVDGRGRPVEGLAKEDFKVYEDGVEQDVRRFELVRDVPIYAGVLLDTSGSMGEGNGEKLKAAVRGALTFFENVITPKDRAAVITFADEPSLAVRFTNQQEVLAGGLAGLTAVGDTALHDSIVYALYYFGGLKGKRAIILLSDGQDYGSKYDFGEALDYARRSGVAIYSVGIDLKELEVRTKLVRLSEETGGRAFFIGAAGELSKVFETVEKELRSQYMLAYQSSNPGRDDKFRTVEVKIAKPGLEAKTVRGYYP
ncbi:MAG TPA: VWA domain-containing protein [Thermoanaerobaculia bacterium]|jgi:VWFA-related protein|nr:VWA domain-containing protein [Thermoanaerobaculia bacterium]